MMPPELAAGQPVPFQLRRSSRLRAYVLLGGSALLAGVILGRPEGVVLAAPFLLSAIAVALLTNRPRLMVDRRLGPDRTVEGRSVSVMIRFTSPDRPVRVAWALLLPDELADIHAPRATTMTIRPGYPVTVERTVQCRRWGALHAGALRLRTAGPLGLITFEAHLPASLPLRVYPALEPVQAVPRPRQTQSFAGNALASRSGDGIEFADIRTFTPGDSLRRVNWRVSARARTLAVNVQHLERNVDVILFLDAFTEQGQPGQSTLDRTLAAATSLARTVLTRRDRVGLISYGGSLRWLAPGMGAWQRWRIADTLIDTRIEPSYAWKSIAVIPPRILPPDALVIGVTPLHDQRIMDALLQVRGRRHDVAVLEVTPNPPEWRRGDRAGRLAEKVWRMQREAARHRLRAAGIGVASWVPGGSLQAAIEEVRAFRRRQRLPA